MKVQRKAGPGAQQLRVMLDGLANKVARVGFFPSSKYEDGTSVAYVAAIQEFGAPSQGIPPRPFMRPTADAQRGAWQATARQGAQAVAKGSATGVQVLDAIGQLAAGDIRKAISNVASPPLKQSTIDARLRQRADKVTLGKLNKPLVDTGTLLNAVTSEVGDK
jgi:hypothetical protein